MSEVVCLAARLLQKQLQVADPSQWKLKTETVTYSVGVRQERSESQTPALSLCADPAA